MSGSYEKPITILQAIRNIDDRTFLLPAIQRNFVWSAKQVCVLFDSLMSNYPINTMMLWDVTSPEVKNHHRFYSFLNDYCERFKVSNEYVPTQGDFKDFKAVIDGQQRLTSIYIGLKGTYAWKAPRMWWPTTRDDRVLPPRKLYLDILNPAGAGAEGNELMTSFDFRFFTRKQAEANAANPKVHYFEVGKVLQLPPVATVDKILFEVVMPYLAPLGLSANAYALQTLTRLYYLVRHEPVIHYYCEQSQDIDHVLDVFIRTNSGGTPLSFSDLLMSIAVANWGGDARKDIDDLITEARQSVLMQFGITRDWVLKSCLVLTGADVEFRVANFGPDRVATIEAQWAGLRHCLSETLKFARSLGLNDSSLRAKNALIPVAYYLYSQTWQDKPLYHSINNLAYLRTERELISRWLHTALLRGTFGGQSDGVLRRMRRLIRDNLKKGAFPLEEIVAGFAGRNKDMRFDEEYLRGLLDIRHGDSRCRSVLSLLYPEVNDNQQLDIDHLHPSSAFAPKLLAAMPWLSADPARIKFYRDEANWNSIVNLHLLNASQNRSKQHKTLAEWIESRQGGFSKADLLLEPHDSLSFKDFEAFCARRRERLLARLRTNVIMSGQPLDAIDALTDYEEAGEESELPAVQAYSEFA